MKTYLLSLCWVIGFSGLGSLGACGGDDGDAGATAMPMPAAQTVSASGGEVKTQGATVGIPAGALASSVEITIEPMNASALPDPASIASPVFDFGPDGTQFSMPVELELQFDTTMLKEGSQAVMAYLADGKWVQLDDSVVSGNKVTASTLHFTPFAIIIVAGVGQVAGACSDTLDFAACGGDLVGSWNFTLGCVSADNILERVKESCPGATISAIVDLTGEVTFNADKTFAVDQTVDLMFTLSLPKSCLGGADAKCEDFGDDDDEEGYKDAGDACEAKMNQTTMAKVSGTYETNGGTLTTVVVSDGKSTPAGSADYCVKGNRATVRSQEGEGETFVYEITRK